MWRMTQSDANSYQVKSSGIYGSQKPRLGKNRRDAIPYTRYSSPKILIAFSQIMSLTAIE